LVKGINNNNEGSKMSKEVRIKCPKCKSDNLWWVNDDVSRDCLYEIYDCLDCTTSFKVIYEKVISKVEEYLD